MGQSVTSRTGPVFMCVHAAIGAPRVAQESLTREIPLNLVKSVDEDVTFTMLRQSKKKMSKMLEYL